MILKLNKIPLITTLYKDLLKFVHGSKQKSNTVKGLRTDGLKYSKKDGHETKYDQKSLLRPSVLVS